MLSYLSVFMVILLFHSCDSINCTDMEMRLDTKVVLRNTTCEGDVCVNYKNKGHVDKTCATLGSFKFTLRWDCIQPDDMDDFRVFCFCYTDYCNTGRTHKGAALVDQFNCTTFVPGSNDTYTRAPVCSMRVVERGNGRTIKKTGEIDDEGALPLPPTRQARLDFFTYLVGYVHTTTGIEKDLKTHDYKCLGDHCNDEVDIESLPVKTSVTCHTNQQIERCNGDFCIIATNITNTLKYCLSTHNITGTQQYQVGMFKYKKSTFYLCKENNCNSDEGAARISIANSRIIVEEQPVDNGVNHLYHCVLVFYNYYFVLSSLIVFN